MRAKLKMKSRFLDATKQMLSVMILGHLIMQKRTRQSKENHVLVNRLNIPNTLYVNLPYRFKCKIKKLKWKGKLMNAIKLVKN